MSARKKRASRRANCLLRDGAFWRAPGIEPGMVPIAYNFRPRAFILGSVQRAVDTLQAVNRILAYPLICSRDGRTKHYGAKGRTTVPARIRLAARALKRVRSGIRTVSADKKGRAFHGS